MVYKMDEKDDFFGIEKATEIPLPHHMKAAIMSRSRTTVKKYCEASNKRSAVSDQRSAYFGSKFYSNTFQIDFIWNVK